MSGGWVGVSVVSCVISGVVPSAGGSDAKAPAIVELSRSRQSSTAGNLRHALAPPFSARRFLSSEFFAGSFINSTSFPFNFIPRIRLQAAPLIRQAEERAEFPLYIISITQPLHDWKNFMPLLPAQCAEKRPLLRFTPDKKRFLYIHFSSFQLCRAGKRLRRWQRQR